MWYSLPRELVSLTEEYRNSVTTKDKRIKQRLKEIADCYRECAGVEHEFADDITKKFCEIIEILNEQQMGAEAISAPIISAGNNYMTYTPNPNMQNERIPFETREQLVVAFYNRFRNEQRKQSQQERPHYPEIYTERDLKEFESVNLTLRDYIARINTFFNQYMREMPRICELWHNTQTKEEPILFVYRNVELILANFDTRSPSGEINKQKSNIQSALRKLNEFKREQNNKQ